MIPVSVPLRHRATEGVELVDDGAGQMPPDVIKAIKLQICLGARIGEVAGMAAEELETEGKRLLWTLPATRSKNKQEHVMPLVGMARE